MAASHHLPAGRSIELDARIDQLAKAWELVDGFCAGLSQDPGWRQDWRLITEELAALTGTDVS